MTRKRKPQVIGALTAGEAAARLEASGDTATAARIRMIAGRRAGLIPFARLRLGWPRASAPPAYQYTEHAFGYVPKNDGPDFERICEITDAGNIHPDVTLRDAIVKITLDRLRVFEYPGGGTHTVLFDFYAQHQTASRGESQDLHFTQKYRVREGSGAGIIGYPVFVGLGVGREGVVFKGFTVNIANADDDRLLGFLESDVFRSGLKLIGAVNPAIPVVTGFATGIASAFARRNENIPVQDFYMGLDFSSVQTRAQLREGSYIAVQVPDAAEWDWSQWIYKRSNGQIVARRTPSRGLPLNYLVFSVSRM